MKAEDSNSSKPNILDTIKLSKALRLAKRKSKDGQLEEAKNIYEDILQKFSKNKEALSELRLLAGGATVEPQDPPSEQLQSIINLYTQGQLQQALSHITEMLERFPNSVVLYNIAGASNAGLMQFDAAIDSYKQALKIKPDYADAYNNMGIALNNKGDLEAAINSYKQALKINPDYALAYNNMGIALYDKRNSEAAINSYKQALKIKPDYAEAYNNMGNALKVKGDLDAAIDSYEQAIKIKPDYVEAYSNMGNALKVKGDLGAAIDSYKQALKIKPDYADAYCNLLRTSTGLLQPHTLGNLEKNFLRIFKTNENSIIAKFARANLLRHQRKTDLSFKLICEANKLKKESLETELHSTQVQQNNILEKIKKWKPNTRKLATNSIKKDFHLGSFEVR
jgi:tetratricopeptide (TPR) repeat protein